MKSVCSGWFPPRAAPADAPPPAVPSLAELVALRQRLGGSRVIRNGWRSSVALAPAPGAHRSRLPGRGMEFAELRPYQRGDDVRSIDWRHTAKRGRPYTKAFHAERERPVLLLIDLQPSMRFGTRGTFKSALAARAAALLAWSAVGAGDRVGAVLCDVDGYRVIPAQSRQRGAFELMHALATGVDPQDVTRPSPTDTPTSVRPRSNFAGAVHALGRIARAGSETVVLSDFCGLDADAEAALAALAARSALALVQVFDPLEAEPPPAGLYRFADAHRDRVLDLRSAAARSAYGHRFRERRSALAALARRLRAALVPLSTEDDAARVLHALHAAYPSPAHAAPYRAQHA